MRRLVWLAAALLGCSGTVSNSDGGTGGGSGGGVSAGGGSGGGSSTGGGSSVGGGTATGGGSSVGGGTATGGGSSTGGGGGGTATGGGSGTGGGGGGGGTTITTPPTVFVGSGNGDITVFTLDENTGALTQNGVASGGTNPSYLAISPSRRRLYAVNEASPNGMVVAFDLAPDGGLTMLNQQSSQGAGPAHLSVDPTGAWVLVANYNSGTVAVLPATDAGLGAFVDSESPGMNAHQIQTDSSDTHAFVPCLGSDLVALFDFDRTSGQLTAHSPPSVATASGAGPRHLALHPSGRFAYLLNETASTITALSLDAGTLSPLQTQSTLPSGFSGSNTGAHVLVHPSGNFVFSSNRGEDTIVSFAVNADGTLSFIGRKATGGQMPRDFTLTQDGHWLLVANQTSGNVHVFAVDADAGTLTAAGTPVTMNAPAFVGAWSLPP